MRRISDGISHKGERQRPNRQRKDQRCPEPHAFYFRPAKRRVMAARPRSESTATDDPKREPRVDVSVCESCPGTAVFIESENTEGWIASDATVAVTR